MKYILTFLLLSITLSIFSQSNIAETVKFKVIIDGEDMPGAIIRIKDASYETITNINGKAELLIPYDKNDMIINFLGPQAIFKIIHPADYVLVDLDKKRATIFYQKKKIKQVKIKISGY